MRILFIGDIVGRPGREMIKKYLPTLKSEHDIDFVIANYENASHGFGLTPKNADELFGAGIDCMTGGNHTWDKKDLLPLFETHNILRPHNYPPEVEGTGCKVFDVAGEKLAVLNIMGHYGMPMCENPFRCAKESVESLHNDGIKNIFLDLHAEATAEKRGMMMLLQGQVSAIVGTHTHVSTDDLQISNNTAYITDVGLTGCRDNVIGMDAQGPLHQFMTGLKAHYDIPKKCKKILQCLIVDIEDGKAVDTYKLKLLDDGREFRSEAWREEA